MYYLATLKYLFLVLFEKCYYNSSYRNIDQNVDNKFDIIF